LRAALASAQGVGRLGVIGLRAEKVVVDLGGRRVVDAVDLDVQAGSVLALVGPNGAGKSTLLSVLSGEREPSSGRVMIGERPVRSIDALELARMRAVLTQDNAVSFPFLVGQVVEMGRSPWNRTANREEDTAIIADALERTDV